MSSIFDLPERVQRLRQMFSFFRDAALLAGAEVRDSVEAGSGAKAQDEWRASPFRHQGLGRAGRGRP